MIAYVTMAIDPLSTRDLCGNTARESGDVEIIRDFTYRFRPGTFYLLSGAESGGKRLLLSMLGLLTTPDSGEIMVDGSPVSDLDIDGLGEIRNRKYGFLFSSAFLLPAFTVLENVAMPLFKITQVDAVAAQEITEEILDIVGISRLAAISAANLDGPYEMLTALARALVHHPRILIAELVGTRMDTNEADALLWIIRASCQRLGVTAIATLASHVCWMQADIRLEIGRDGVKEFTGRDPHG
jgi:ABC-type lipoprotein export system ATPase subunit